MAQFKTKQLKRLITAAAAASETVSSKSEEHLQNLDVRCVCGVVS